MQEGDKDNREGEGRVRESRILFCSCLCKVHSRISDALSQALCNLSLAFLADFALSYTTALIRFIAFSRKLHSAFCLDRKT